MDLKLLRKNVLYIEEHLPSEFGKIIYGLALGCRQRHTSPDHMIEA